MCALEELFCSCVEATGGNRRGGQSRYKGETRRQSQRHRSDRHAWEVVLTRQGVDYLKTEELKKAQAQGVAHWLLSLGISLWMLVSSCTERTHDRIIGPKR